MFMNWKNVFKLINFLDILISLHSFDLKPLVIVFKWSDLFRGAGVLCGTQYGQLSICFMYTQNSAKFCVKNSKYKKPTLKVIILFYS